MEDLGVGRTLLSILFASKVITAIGLKRSGNVRKLLMIRTIKATQQLIAAVGIESKSKSGFTWILLA
ncbi:hypothetical protein [Alteromonas sp. 5E99-2]|uniref:hypothetical protein n=1 Tax=Alteromonas sp. 5E99-2 TaxID=2817683 RepID=UPI001F6094A0|nr:hypothetical protein [Alteromonas sp. 5E99-2]